MWKYRYDRPDLLAKGETFLVGGYKDVPDGYVKAWPHVTTWPNVPKGKGKALEGEVGPAGIERYMTMKLTRHELRQAIPKLVVTCDLPLRIIDADAVSAYWIQGLWRLHPLYVSPSLQFRELLMLWNVQCREKNFIPSRWAVARDTVVFAEADLEAAIAELVSKVGELGCKASYSMNMWTAPTGKAFIVVTGHWVDDGW
ncbi:unnamed protein product [Closterium sp. Naga37s-1]|nr:unnamed protein product [Closterium sp. Naga37s-1]